MLRSFIARRLACLLAVLGALLASPLARAATEPWIEALSAIPIQDGGRVMPLDTYARALAAQVTGRTRWSAGAGPEAYSGRQPVELLCDMLFSPHDLLNKPLFGIENRPFKQKIGLEAERRFFSANEIVACRGLDEVLNSLQKAREKDPNAQPDREQRQALDLRGSIDRLSTFIAGEGLPLVPTAPGQAFLRAGLNAADPGAEPVKAALAAVGEAYRSRGDMNAAVNALAAAIKSAGTLDPADTRRVELEIFYNHHNPWMATAVLYGLGIVLLGISRLALRRPMVILAAICVGLGVIEHLAGLGLRVAILGRAPVSNTYEALLWMGLVGMALGLVAQLINRKAWYLFGGIAVAELSVLFSNLVPLESQTNALPAVLRSNYWLIVHVLTIVASYGILAVASLLAHVYLVKEVLLKRRDEAPAAPSRLSHPMIAQVYRSIQLGVLMLTAGTILGGVWAADSWGRFWGWDPKETWALISILVYFAVLHARYVRWLRDFGLAASAVLGFAAIVWTFYGVNYLMAAGLHSYGFGSGGGGWVAAWAIAEIVFVGLCKARLGSLQARAAENPASRPANPPTPAVGGVN